MICILYNKSINLLLILNLTEKKNTMQINTMIERYFNFLKKYVNKFTENSIRNDQFHTFIKYVIV